jgi:transcriptional regulator with XRE-family HTH domain
VALASARGGARRRPCALVNGIGRHRLHYHWLFNKGSRVLSPRFDELGGEGRWEMLYRTSYSLMVGRRLKRIREGRGLTQGQALGNVRRPNGKGYSQGSLSRIEAGYANSPLYAYMHLADGYGLDPARVLGPEEAERKVSEAEATLIKSLRRLGIGPDEAIARVLRR